MMREHSNGIRFVLEELLPPVVRDSAAFQFSASLIWGKHISRLADFRKRAPFVSAREYESLYRTHPRVHENTDNSAACLEKIAENALGGSLLDVGCGTGYLLRHVRAQSKQSFERMVGVDIVTPRGHDDIEFVDAMIENLPFRDHSFDTVLCTHVLEHILDYRKAIAELRRIAGRRLIIVVPRERESIYTFNPHFNFFPYRHSFLRAMIPVPENHLCLDVGRDIFYMEERLS